MNPKILQRTQEPDALLVRRVTCHIAHVHMADTAIAKRASTSAVIGDS